MGNCGVGFAPVRPGTEDELVELMETVEDIPGTALHEGIPWGWETFGAVPRHIDTPLQRRHRRPGPPRRPALLRDGRALLRRRHRRGHRPRWRRSPARRWPTGARLLHLPLLRPPRQGRRGRARARTPTADEMVAIAEALRDFGHGTMEIISDLFDQPDELAWIEHIARLTGRPGDAAGDGHTSTAASGTWPTRLDRRGRRRSGPRSAPGRRRC